MKKYYEESEHESNSCGKFKIISINKLDGLL